MRVVYQSPEGASVRLTPKELKLIDSMLRSAIQFESDTPLQDLGYEYDPPLWQQELQHSCELRLQFYELSKLGDESEQ